MLWPEVACLFGLALPEISVLFCFVLKCEYGVGLLLV